MPRCVLVCTPHTHTTEIWLGEVVFICNLAKREEGKKKKKNKHILIAVRTQSKIREL